MDRRNQPVWLRLLNAASVLAIVMFIFAYQGQLKAWPSYLCILVFVIGAGANFYIHLRDVLIARPRPERVSVENVVESEGDDVDLPAQVDPATSEKETQ